MYTLNITVQAKKDIAFLKKNGGKAVANKIEKLLVELILNIQKLELGRLNN